jgi:hypothetical protein
VRRPAEVRPARKYRRVGQDRGQDGRVTIDLLPAVGILLPASLPELRFGMSRSDVYRAMEDHAPVVDAFVCGFDWTACFSLSGCSVGVSGSSADGLAAVYVDRQRTGEHTAGPVGFLDIDLFGWPASRIVLALRELGQPVTERHGTVRIDGLHLNPASESGGTATVRRKPRRPSDRVFDHASLYAPGVLSRLR